MCTNHILLSASVLHWWKELCRLFTPDKLSEMFLNSNMFHKKDVSVRGQVCWCSTDMQVMTSGFRSQHVPILCVWFMINKPVLVQRCFTDQLCRSTCRVDFKNIFICQIKWSTNVVKAIVTLITVFAFCSLKYFNLMFNSSTSITNEYSVCVIWSTIKMKMDDLYAVITES